MIIPVSDASDPRLAPFRWRDRQLASRLDRQETVGAGLFVAEGDLVVERALAQNCTPHALLCDSLMATHFNAQLPHIDIYEAPETIRRDVTGLGVPLRAMGLFIRPSLVPVEQLLSQCTRVVVAEAIDNPTNVGAIIRSAVALGWDGLLLTEGSADPLARRALRVSMGTALSLPFARHTSTDDVITILRQHAFHTVALSPSESATSIQSLSLKRYERLAVLLGSERDGLTSTSLSASDHIVRIPMHNNTDSLNVGAAAAIAFFALGPHAS